MGRRKVGQGKNKKTWGCPFRLSPCPTIWPWVSEDASYDAYNITENRMEKITEVYFTKKQEELFFFFFFL